jgi:hypothetical protein
LELENYEINCPSDTSLDGRLLKIAFMNSLLVSNNGLGPGNSRQPFIMKQMKGDLQ